MTFASATPRSFLPIFSLLTGLLCFQGACSLRSLDYLKNGPKQDGAARDSAGKDAAVPSSPDAATFDAVRPDVASDGVGRTDGPDGENLDTGMADTTIDREEPDAGTEKAMAFDGAGDVFIDAIEDVGRDKAVGSETGDVSIDEAGSTVATDAAPEIDGAILDSQNPDVANADGPLADRVLLDSPIPDS